MRITALGFLRIVAIAFSNLLAITRYPSQSDLRLIQFIPRLEHHGGLLESCVERIPVRSLRGI